MTRMLLLVVWCAAALSGAADWSAFDSVVERGMRELRAPGAAVGVIQDGKVVFAKGYGVRDLKSKQAVTAKTLFGMGSVSKSFTSAVLATLVDEGKLGWDVPVRNYLPWFRMSDPIATELVTVRDMLTHRSGLPGHNFIRFSTYMTREELVRRIRYLEPNRTFRDVYQYNNLMYTAAGYIGGVLAGSTWEDLVRERLFVPIGMTRSNTSTLDSQKSDDFAKPHTREGEQEFYVYQKFGVGPNGAVNSCVDDMLKYLQMYLDKGEVNGRQVISRTQIAELHKPVTVVNATASYALGWQTGFYRGHRLISHGGAITGFRASMMLLPNERTGIVAMINAEESLADALTQTLADQALGLAPEDHIRRPPSSQPAETTHTISLPEGYAGTYENPAYGRVTVGDGRVHFNALSMSLKDARFLVDEKGQVREMHLPLEQAVKPFVFVKLTTP